MVVQRLVLLCVQMHVTEEVDESYYLLEDFETQDSYVLTDLVPNTQYTVTVQSKLVKAHGDLFWSNVTNSSTLTFRTYPAGMSFFQPAV